MLRDTRYKSVSYSKSVAGLLPCSHQADIKMRSHRLLRVDDNTLQVINRTDVGKITFFSSIHISLIVCALSR